MSEPIYLDYNSTTPVDPRVLEAMLPYFGKHFGNAASRTHTFGWTANEAVEAARREVAKLLGARPREMIFTSGATESNNLAILGAVREARSRRPAGSTVHVITSRVEHHAVLDPCAELEKEGVEVTYVKPDSFGRVSPGDVEDALRDDTVLVSIMAGNNEIGTLYPLKEIGAVCRAAGVYFHTDAAQTIGKIPIQVDAFSIDLLSISGHKLYGPKGIGALFVRGRNPRVRLTPILYGGGHERGLRSGTINVPGAVGLGCACRIASEEMDAESRRVEALRRRLHKGIQGALDGVTLNGHPDERLSGNLNLSFSEVAGESLIVGLRDISVSSGSACTSQVPEPSYVLRAIGVSAELAHASIRFGLGRFTTEGEIDRAIDCVRTTVQRLREISRAVGGPSPS